MRIVLVCLMMIMGFTGFGTSAYAACQNKVGGVCIDSQSAKPSKKRVKKKTTRKKTVKKKQVSKPEVEVKTITANSCVTTTIGKRFGVGDMLGMTFRKVVVVNKCAKSVNAYVSLNSCRSPRSFFVPFVGQSKKKVSIKPQGKISLTVSHVDSMKAAEVLAKVNAVYKSDGRGGYLKNGC